MTRAGSKLVYLLSLSLLSVGAFASRATAQPYDQGWLFIGAPLTGPGIAVGHLDENRTRTTLVATGTLLGDAQGAALEVDNGDLLVAHSRQSGPQHVGGVHRISRAGQVLGTLISTATHPGIYNDVALTADGDYAIAAGPVDATPGHVTIARRGGGLTTVFTGNTASGPLAIATDQRTGDLVVLEGPLPHTALLSVPLEGGAATTIAVLPIGGSQIAQDQRTGDWLVGASTGLPSGAVVLRVTSAGVVSTVLASGFVDAAALCVERASAYRPTAHFATGPFGTGVHALDLANQRVTTIASVPVYAHAHLIPEASVNVAPVRREPGLVDVSVSFPTQGGWDYVLAISASGCRPGVRLSDGRRILLNPDALTFAAVANRLGSVFTGGAGRLGATGLGSAAVDTRTLRGVAGVRLWCVALTLDRSAPNGIRTISEPRVIRL